MNELFHLLGREFAQTAMDLGPIVGVMAVFLARFLKDDRALIRRALIGLAHLAVGLTMLRIDIHLSLLPLGAELAEGLSARVVDGGGVGWIGALIGFATTLAAAAAFIEPTLIATADRVHALSGGSVRPTMLRVVVSAGIGLGLGLGVLRLVMGWPLASLLVPMVATLSVLVLAGPRELAPLALDSGAIATSIVTVPIIAAYGISVAETLPGRSPLADGFGLIALAMIGSAIAVMATATLNAHLTKRRNHMSSDRGRS